ncbi:MAG: Flp pilus assembly complex ATPase component TadA [Thermoplasmata archaeon]|nr:Flp pilus assembly complex ATPase component TadA [Thermoplasmata archaeon]
MDWLEKYKPKSIDEVVGNEELKEAVKHWIQHPDEMPHLLFAGKTGTGKTTMAYIIAKEILKDGFAMSFKEINASDNNNVDFIRNVVIKYMRYSPMFGVPYKILLLDEADYLTPEAQATLRRPLEKYKKNCRVIMTANNPNKIIDAIKQGRVAFFKFGHIPRSEMKMRLEFIARNEGVDVDIDDIVDEADGSMRNAIAIMQQKAISGRNEIEKIITAYLGV